MSKNALKKQVQLFYDVLSPYSWIAFESLCRYRTKWNFDLILQPFLIAGVMKESGNKPPLMVQNKATYMLEDLQRLSRLHKIPILIPKDVYGVIIERGSMNAQRLLTAVKMEYPSTSVESLSRQLWGRVWGRNEDICDNTSLNEALLRAGFKEEEGKRMLERINHKDVKDTLKRVTQEAVKKHKIFGAPSIVVQETESPPQMIFGSDRMEVLAMLMGEKYEGPLTSLAVSRL